MKRNDPVETYDKIAEIYNQLVGIDIKQTNEEIEALLILLKENKIDIKQAIIADIGGGTGRLAFPLSNLCKKVILVDPSKEMIKVAKRHYASGKYGDIEYRQEGFLNLSILPNSVDIVIAFFGVFQYLLKLEEHLAALKNVYNILKPGGLIVIDVMNYFSIIKKYSTPKTIVWKNNSHIYKRDIKHKVHAIESIWEHKTTLSIEDCKNNKFRRIKSTHNMKMFSPTELHLLFQQTGFVKINHYPGRDLNANDGNRIWIAALKPN